MLSGDNGILQKVTAAKEQTGIGQEKEIVTLAYNSALTKKISNNASTPVSASDLNTELANQGASADGNNPIIVTFENQHKYSIDNMGNIAKYTPIPITKIELKSAISNIQQGRSLTLEALKQPINATENVKWKLIGTEIPGVVLNESTGKITVSKTVPINKKITIKSIR